MFSVNTNGETGNPVSGPPYKFRILVMCDGELHPATYSELEQVPGSIIETCHDFLELQLHLEHETFQVVMIFEEDRPSLDCRAAANYLAEAYRGTPVLVTKRSAIDRYSGTIWGYLN